MVISIIIFNLIARSYELKKTLRYIKKMESKSG